MGVSRVRLLVATDAEDAASEWNQWQEEKSKTGRDSAIALQRLSKAPAGVALPAIGIGFEETLRWFGPIGSADLRKQVLEYARRVLDEGSDAPLPPALQRISELFQPGTGGEDGRQQSTRGALVLLSHAETDLLALDRARIHLPGEMPEVRRGSLAGCASLEDLLKLIGPRSRNLAVILRIHGVANSVPGLNALAEFATREGWTFVVISGVGGNPGDLPHSPAVTDELGMCLSAYFLEGGATNVAQALRCAAARMLGSAVSYMDVQPMPAHGLYHPDLLVTTAAEWEAHRDNMRPEVWVLFYRAHILSGNLEFIDATIRALEARGLAAVGIFTSSLRERDTEGVPQALRLLQRLPDLLLSTVSYPVFTLSSVDTAVAGAADSPFERLGVPLLQAICSASPRAQWQASSRGLPPAEAAMNVALPECDGRIGGPPISFKESHRYVPDPERLERLAGLAQRIVRLRRQPNRARRVAIILNNTGGKAQRVGSAVGLDVPASLLALLRRMKDAGYQIGDLPDSADELMADLLSRGSYDATYPLNEAHVWRMPREQYVEWFEHQAEGFRDTLSRRWGVPTRRGPTLAPPLWRGAKESSQRLSFVTATEPHSDDTHFLFAGLEFGNVLVAIQPPRAYGVSAEEMYHAGDLPPTHHYAAFYRWLAQTADVDALVHLGAHGTLEWLPGKSVALSAQCTPDVLLGELPLIYPFVVNNPGEAAQAKRRAHAIIIDHLTPPVTQAGVSGALAQLARLVEDYYRAEAFDTAKLPLLREQIWDWVRVGKLEEDLRQIRLERHGDHMHGWDDTPNVAGVPRSLDQLSGRAFAHLVEDLDTYLCDLGRAQIRGGLHVLGRAPEGEDLLELLVALTRSSHGSCPSLPGALADCQGLDLEALSGATGFWAGKVPECLRRQGQSQISASELRAALDERVRGLIRDLAGHSFSSQRIDALLAEQFPQNEGVHALREVLGFICEVLVPRLARTSDEIDHILAALAGRYIPAGPSGSPLRGMAHVLPTGRNLYTVDPRTLPTPAAWIIGQELAVAVLARYRRDTGTYPESVALSLWGTPAMRTGGDDLAQALALIGARPQWDPESRRLSGFEVVPLAELGRPRIDVILRVSGFFRDAFPSLMQLFADAVEAVARLPEPPEKNFVRKRWLATRERLIGAGQDSERAARLAALRVFSSRPGHYGTGVGAAIESAAWRSRRDLGDIAVQQGGWAFSSHYPDGLEAATLFRERLAEATLVLHTQDIAESDLFDSSEVFEYQGGLIAAIEGASGRSPRAYVSDTSQPSRRDVRTLQMQALRVFRSRVLNPKWQSAMRSHGYRGAMEMAATAEAVFGFSATAEVISDEMFEQLAESFTAGENGEFLLRKNVWALNAIAQRLLEAHQRGLWNARRETLEQLGALMLQSETAIEQAAENEL
jgi:cobaltochelatase CobN